MPSLEFIPALLGLLVLQHFLSLTLMLPHKSVKKNALPQVKSIIKTTLICKAALIDYKQLSQSVSKIVSITFSEKN